ncbi:MAG: hypothetical protein JXL97_04030 [Bacteroidales bacterium]|nr:hypothetical protein [Bacteroidales bacterium]
MKNIFKILLFFLIILCFSISSYSQNIQAGSTIYHSNIYHNGGNVGIGTTTPNRLFEVHSSFSDTSFMRLSYINEGPACKTQEDYIWEIGNNKNLYFNSYYTKCGSPFPTITTMTLTQAGQVIVGGTTADNSAVFEVDATNKGVLIPRLTQIEIEAISSPANGLLVFNSELNRFQFYNNEWLTLITENESADYLTIVDFNNQISNYVTNNNLEDTLSYYSLNSEIFNTYLTINDFNTNIANYVDIMSLNDTLSYYSTTENIIPNSLVFSDSQGVFSSMPYGSSGNILSVNEFGELTWVENTNHDNYWESNGSNVILNTDYDYVGIGTNNPQKQLHLYNKYTGTGQELKSTIRLQNFSSVGKGEPGPGPTPYNPLNFVWDIENNHSSLFFNFSSELSPLSTMFTISENGKIGIATTEPQKTVHLKSEDNMPTIRFESLTDDGSIPDDPPQDGDNTKILTPAYWDIIQNGADLEFFFSKPNLSPSSVFKISKNTSLALPAYNRIYANGYFYCRELIVQKYGSFPDYVFEPNYDLMPLNELEEYINENKHLPDVPTADEIDETGIEVANMTTLLLKKVEELTLYTIEQENSIDDLKQIIEVQQKQIEEQQKQINFLLEN